MVQRKCEILLIRVISRKRGHQIHSNIIRTHIEYGLTKIQLSAGVCIKFFFFLCLSITFPKVIRNNYLQKKKFFATMMRTKLLLSGLQYFS